MTEEARAREAFEKICLEQWGYKREQVMRRCDGYEMTTLHNRWLGFKASWQASASSQPLDALAHSAYLNSQQPMNAQTATPATNNGPFPSEWVPVEKIVQVCVDMASRYDQDIEGCDGDELLRYGEGITCSFRLAYILKYGTFPPPGDAWLSEFTALFRKQPTAQPASPLSQAAGPRRFGAYNLGMESDTGTTPIGAEPTSERQPKCADNDPERDCKCGGERGKSSCMFPDPPAAASEQGESAEQLPEEKEFIEYEIYLCAGNTYKLAELNRRYLNAREAYAASKLSAAERTIKSAREIREAEKRILIAEIERNKSLESQLSQARQDAAGRCVDPSILPVDRPVDKV